jgi:hypothetical protein
VSDLVIRQADGWREISEIVDEAVQAGYVRAQEIWKLAAQGRNEEIERELRVYNSFDEFMGKKMATGFRFMLVPDDINGDSLRVWVLPKRLKR